MRYLGKKLMNILALVTLCAICSSTMASENKIKPFFIGGIANGGDVLHNDSFSDLKAGGLFYIGGGVLYEPENSDFMYQASLGHKMSGANFILLNVDVSGKERTKILRVSPLDLVAFYKVKKFILGLGLAYFMDPEYERCSKNSGCSKIAFDNAVGTLAELRYRIQEDVFMGIRFTRVEYEASSRTVDASNVRLHFGLSF